MERFSSSILRHNKFITILVFVIVVVCVILQFGVNVNFNVVDYLPKNAPSTTGISVMSKEFSGAVPNTRVMFPNVSVTEALERKAELAAIDGVSDVMWLDDVMDVKQPLETADPKIVETYYKGGDAVIAFAVREGEEVAIMEKVYALIGTENFASGDAVSSYIAQSTAGNETFRAMLILIPLILLILTISTTSWLEPLLFLLTIGVAVFMNMGTNIFFGEVSFVTRSVSPILQLAVSLDYAIFLLHSFQDFRSQTDDVTEAMRLAIKRAFPAVAASAMTTLFGFLALCFMEFGIGVDLGLNLVKGILLSFGSVMIFLPAVTLWAYKWIDKTRHRPFLPSFKNAGRFFTAIRIPALLVVVVIAIPCFLAQGQNTFSYGMGGLAPGTRVETDTARIDEAFGKSMPMVVLVPKGDVAQEKQLGEALSALPHVTSVMSYANTVGAAIPPDYLDKSIVSNFYSEHYARFILNTDTEAEGEDAFAAVESIRAKTSEFYSESYTCGESSTLYDMKGVVTKDNALVNLLAVISIALVLLFTFKSISLPLILLLTIETSIWINMSFPYFMGMPLSYIGYLVISTVQLGATVDYAILFTDHFRELRKTLPAKEAVKKTYGQTLQSILVSATTLAMAGFTMQLTSTNRIVQGLGELIGRGTMLSALMVCCFLPALLIVLDRLVGVTTLHPNFFRERKRDRK